MANGNTQFGNPSKGSTDRNPDITTQSGLRFGELTSDDVAQVGQGGVAFDPQVVQEQIKEAEEEAQRIADSISDLQQGGGQPSSQQDSQGKRDDERFVEGGGEEPPTPEDAPTEEPPDGESERNSVIAEQDATRQEVLNQVVEQQRELQSTLKEQREQSQERASAIQDRISTLRENAPDQQELFNQALERFGVTQETFQQQQELIGEMRSINNKIAEMRGQAQQQKVQVDEEATPNFIKKGEKALIDRNLAARVAPLEAKATAAQAQFEAIRGNITQAQQLARQTVSAATTEHKQNLTDLQFMMNTKQDFINSMNKQEIQTINKAIEANKNILKQEKERVSFNQQLMVKAAENGAKLNYNPAEISKEEATRQFNNAVSAKVQEELDTSFTESEEKDIGAVAQVHPEITEFPENTKNALIQHLSTDELSRFMEDWKKETEKRGTNVDVMSHLLQWSQKQSESGGAFGDILGSSAPATGDSGEITPEDIENITGKQSEDSPGFLKSLWNGIMKSLPGL